MAHTRTCLETAGTSLQERTEHERRDARIGEAAILYLGSEAFAPQYLAYVEERIGTKLLRSPHFRVPAGLRDVQLVLFEADAPALRPLSALQSFIHAFGAWPLVALTRRDREHRGVAAVRSGAQSFVCVDDPGEVEQAEVFAHARRRHRLLQRLSHSDGTVLSILHSLNDGVIVVDREAHVLDINPAGRSILGLARRPRPAEGLAEQFGALAGDGVTGIARAELPLVKAGRGQQFAEQTGTWHGPEEDDRRIVLSASGQGLYDDAGTLIGGVVSFRDVTDAARRTAELARRAQYDEVTLLPNRGMFLRQLEKAIGRGRRISRPVAVLFIDLDRFKSVNDTLGHDAGDELLRQVGERLTKYLRVGDFSGRWGGDEFAVCLEDCAEPRNAAAAAQKLVLVLAEKYAVAGGEVYVTPSIGVATWPECGGTAEALVKAADLAMYEAKKRGGGRFHFFSEALNSQLAQREELELGLRHALVRDEFVLHYQPRIDVASGRLIGLEALLRWQHPSYGLLPPARFLAILESSGLIHSAGEWVLGTAARQLAAWQRQYELPDLAMAINLSPQQLKHGRIVETLGRVLEETALDPGCLELEINDGELVASRSAQLETLQGLRALGVRLSLDRFGTRDISFRSLDTGVIDGFVLDPALIQDVAENDSHQRIVRAAIAMARGLDLEVAAEGVETAGQLDFLKRCQCDLAQGFLISRPINADKVHAVLRSEIAGNRLLAQQPSV